MERMEGGMRESGKAKENGKGGWMAHGVHKDRAITQRETAGEGIRPRQGPQAKAKRKKASDGA